MPSTNANRVVPFFELFDTWGIPLDTIFEVFHSNGVLPDWKDFWVKAESKNWNPYSTLGKLKEAVVQVYDDDFAKNWETRMKHCISTKWGYKLVKD